METCFSLKEVMIYLLFYHFHSQFRFSSSHTIFSSAIPLIKQSGFLTHLSFFTVSPSSHRFSFCWCFKACFPMQIISYFIEYLIFYLDCFPTQQPDAPTKKHLLSSTQSPSALSSSPHFLWSWISFLPLILFFAIAGFNFYFQVPSAVHSAW